MKKPLLSLILTMVIALSAEAQEMINPPKVIMKNEQFQVNQNAAKEGDPLAQFKIGEMYYLGKNVTKNYDESIKFLTLSANQGYMPAQSLLGQIYIQQSIKWFTKAGDQGSGIAPIYLAAIYNAGLTGHIEKMPNYIEAEKWLTKNLEKFGDEFSAIELAEMYEEGRLGIPVDYNKAIKWYLFAAEHSNSKAQYKLGMIYAIGKGVPKSDINALMWVNISAEHGYKDAIWVRDKLFDSMTPQDIDIAQKLTVKWYVERFNKYK